MKKDVSKEERENRHAVQVDGGQGKDTRFATKHEVSDILENSGRDRETGEVIFSDNVKKIDGVETRRE